VSNGKLLGIAGIDPAHEWIHRVVEKLRTESAPDKVSDAIFVVGRARGPKGFSE
jgi:hypothetical protein